MSRLDDIESRLESMDRLLSDYGSRLQDEGLPTRDEAATAEISPEDAVEGGASVAGAKTDLDSKTDVLTGNGGASWTTYDASALVPVGAKRVILEVEMLMSVTPTGAKYIKVRKEDGAIEKTIARTQGSGSGDLTAMAGQADCELTGDRTFDYFSDNVVEHIIRITGYET